VAQAGHERGHAGASFGYWFKSVTFLNVELPSWKILLLDPLVCRGDYHCTPPHIGKKT
jgi:hypothetical protein